MKLKLPKVPVRLSMYVPTTINLTSDGSDFMALTFDKAISMIFSYVSRARGQEVRLIHLSSM